MCQYFQKIVDSADSDYGKVMEKIEDAAILKVYQWMKQNWHMLEYVDSDDGGP